MTSTTEYACTVNNDVPIPCLKLPLICSYFMRFYMIPITNRASKQLTQNRGHAKALSYNSPKTGS